MRRAAEIPVPFAERLSTIRTQKADRDVFQRIEVEAHRGTAIQNRGVGAGLEEPVTKAGLGVGREPDPGRRSVGCTQASEDSHVVTFFEQGVLSGLNRPRGVSIEYSLQDSENEIQRRHAE